MTWRINQFVEAPLSSKWILWLLFWRDTVNQADQSEMTVHSFAIKSDILVQVQVFFSM